MPRTARIYQRALLYHLINRGLNRQRIFVDDEDRLVFLELTREYKALCGASVYHWVWMDTHYHMLVEIVYENLRAFAGGIQQSYVQYYHARHGTSGTFWQGRFQSWPVEPGEYTTRCARYIERNPVKAGLVESAWAYPWSSARHYVNQVDDGFTDANIYLGAESWDRLGRQQYKEQLMLQQMALQ